MEAIEQAREKMGEGAVDWTMRLFRGGDEQAVVRLINAISEVEGTVDATDDNEYRANLGQPFSHPEEQITLAEGHVTGVPEGVPLGFSRILWLDEEEARQRIYQMRVLVHPAARGRGIEQSLAARALAIARANEANEKSAARERVVLMAGLRADDTAGRALFDEMGLRAIRYGWVMERPLDSIPEAREVPGVTQRTYAKGEDDAASLDAYNNSFIDHFDFHKLTPELWNYRLAFPGVRHDLSWVAEVDAEPGNLAGFCICEVAEQENVRTGRKEGWIALLGTVRRWRGVGLGKALLLRGLHSLAGAGLDTALLGVDSESPTGANHLYESVGFKLRRLEVMYRANLSELNM